MTSCHAPIDEDRRACADALVAAAAGIVAAEVEQVRRVAAWCDLHAALPTRRGERMVTLGGDGTPRVSEFSVGELALLLCISVPAARGWMRDVLDLRHRHPQLWTAVLAGGARFFQARQVVRATRAADLTRDQAREVDARVSTEIGQVGWGRMSSLVETAVIEADPERAEQRRIAAEMARFVRTGRSSEYGTRTIYAKARAGDVVFFAAMCDRIAQILKLQGCLEVAGLQGERALHAADLAHAEMDVLRSLAVGILAVPARALALLAWAEQHHPDPEPIDPEGRERSTRLLEALGVASITELVSALPAGAFLPRATLYVHLDADSFTRTRRGVADLEETGPVTIEQATDLLRHCQVSLQPLLDLNTSPTSDAYAARGRLRDIVTLRHRVEVAPWGTLPARKADADHVTPHAAGGATTPDNLAPLSRYAHRLKTHGGWSLRTEGRGTYLWRTPTGHYARVTPTGTHYLGTDPPRRQACADIHSVGERHLELLLDA